MLHSPGTATFEGFGPCRLASGAEPQSSELALPADRRQSRLLLRELCLSGPGVYGMIDAAGELIYVGKSKSLRDRLLSYFSPAAEGSKAMRIIRRTERLVWEPGPHEFLALARELELIRRFRPALNVRGQPGRRGLGWLCIGREPAPAIHLATKPPAGVAAAFGPLPATRRSRHLVRLVNDCFGLRDCSRTRPIALADQGELFPVARQAGCLRRDLGTCLAPCAAGCSASQYHARLRAARDFLNGHDGAVLAGLASDMQTAAAERRFERAAFLRDRWEGLASLDDHLGRLREARRYTFVYPLRGANRRPLWCLIDRGQIAAAVPGPRDRKTARRCLRLLGQVYPGRRTGPPEPLSEDLEVVLLVASWFHAHPDQLRQTLSPRRARQACLRLAGAR